MQVEGRRIAVVGDMLELGEQSAALHEEAGRYMASRLDVLLTVGDASEHLLAQARQEGMTAQDARHFSSRDELIDHARRLVSDGDTVLVKASRGVGLEHIAEGLLAETTT
jgi:UDP-N-acetylmuramoyl-tripeptide--D-alanyl-D-alanine ligase|tara:strand:- start:25 stop:354 length:330 start_codon:yes stop_codon:yes gene_type:complete